jgi:hypothetical protein
MAIRCDILIVHEITKMVKMERKKLKDSIGQCLSCLRQEMSSPARTVGLWTFSVVLCRLH